MARRKTRRTAGGGQLPPGDGAAAAGGDDAPSAGSTPRRPSGKTSREVYFAVLPDRYEPLEEEEEEEEEEEWRRKEEKKIKTREKHKKYRKNVGRALRWTWRCLVAGLQSLAGVYSAPFTATTTLATACSKA
ncbi:unnamed protein product [Merluccius merluccius]